MSTCEHVGFFYARRYHFREATKMVTSYETHIAHRTLSTRHSGCHPEQYSTASAGLNHLLQQRVWQPFFSAIAVTSVSYMKRELTLGAPSVPVLRLSTGRIRELVNKFLPRECQVKTAQDAWYVAAIGAACVMLVFPPAVGALAWCVLQAKMAGKGGAK